MLLPFLCIYLVCSYLCCYFTFLKDFVQFESSVLGYLHLLTFFQLQMLSFVRQIIVQQSSGFFFLSFQKISVWIFFSSTFQYSSHSVQFLYFFVRVLVSDSFFPPFLLCQLPYLQPLSTFTHTMTLTAGNLCWQSLSPQAKHMPTTSLTCSSL